MLAVLSPVCTVSGTGLERGKILKKSSRVSRVKRSSCCGCDKYSIFVFHQSDRYQKYCRLEETSYEIDAMNGMVHFDHNGTS